MIELVFLVGINNDKALPDQEKCHYQVKGSHNDSRKKARAHSTILRSIPRSH